MPGSGSRLHLFLMFNDQRRHLADFYENIDLGRLEFQLPFFDGDFPGVDFVETGERFSGT